MKRDEVQEMLNTVAHTPTRVQRAEDELADARGKLERLKGSVESWENEVIRLEEAERAARTKLESLGVEFG